MFDVITVGSATVDVFAKPHFSELIKIIKPKGEEDLLALPVGSKILIDEIAITTGGGGTNCAVAYSRLGNKVAFLGKIGIHSNAEQVLTELKKENVTSLAIAEHQFNTGFSIVLDTLEHDRTILAYKGSNNDLKFSEIDLTKLKTKWFYFSSMVGDSMTTQKKLAKWAHKNKIKIAYNPSSYIAERGLKWVKPILQYAEILVLNKEEAALLAHDADIPHLLKHLKFEGPKIVVITDGKNGVYAYDGIRVYTAKPHKIKVVETTGAGDCFAATFTSSIISGKSIETAIKIGITNAESVIKHHGAKHKLLTLPEIEKQLKKQPIKISKKKL